MKYIIRGMQPEDIDGKGTVHYQSWQESYEGIVDSSYLNAMSEEKCRAMAHRWPQNTAVALTADSKVIGFAAWYVSAEGIGEVNAIYLLDAYKKHGIGRALLDYAMAQLSECNRVILWVLKENRDAIGFYERYGFIPTGEERELKLGTPVITVCMEKTFDNLKSL